MHMDPWRNPDSELDDRPPRVERAAKTESFPTYIQGYRRQKRRHAIPVTSLLSLMSHTNSQASNVLSLNKLRSKLNARTGVDDHHRDLELQLSFKFEFQK